MQQGHKAEKQQDTMQKGLPCSVQTACSIEDRAAVQFDSLESFYSE